MDLQSIACDDLLIMKPCLPCFRVERLGYQVPTFDFRLPGVTSMSADIHKYGLGVKVTTLSCMAGFFVEGNEARKISHC